ncbi:MAG TPA: hypothetical protein VLF71_03395 [Candidatus Saccharimonadales bacterium]|nr:hypothetical protein [Candidatus Saccharimonadales bacterium]
MAGFNPQLGAKLNSLWGLSALDLYPGTFEPPLEFDVRQVTAAAEYCGEFPDAGIYYDGIAHITKIRTGALRSGRQFRLFGEPSRADHCAPSLVLAMDIDENECVLGFVAIAMPEHPNGMEVKGRIIVGVPMSILKADPPPKEMHVERGMPHVEGLVDAVAAVVLAAAVNMSGPSGENPRGL